MCIESASMKAVGALAAPMETEGKGREAPLYVLKVGTSSLIVSDSTGMRVQLANIAKLVETIAALKRAGSQVVLVSSGAVGMGCIKLGIPKPKSLRAKQAVAAAGQSRLMRMYEDLFSAAGVHVAQLLISQSDFMEKTHWTNVKDTIHESLKLGLVPIINENDCTSTEELRFGDNDNLAALTAAQLRADGLFLFTDVDFLYTANPNTDPSAEPVRVVLEPWSLNVDTDGASSLGTGGMETKVLAARTASAAGIPCGLIHGAHPERLHSFLGFTPDCEGPLPEGTYFKAMDPVQTIGDTRRWILSLPTAGELELEDGAARAMSNHKSLHPAGIRTFQGRFLRNEVVQLTFRGSQVGRAIVNFSSEDLSKIQGRHSADFEEVLGYACKAEACHRDNILLTVAPEFLRE